MKHDIIPSIGLALGGGAARGYAHIPVLEAFDELGIRPAMITGTSIGSIMGGGYASGMTGSDIREYAVDLFTSSTSVARRLFQERPSIGQLFSSWNKAFFKHEGLFDTLLPKEMKRDFDELHIPLKVVAADFYKQEQVVLESGDLHHCIAASCALPGIIRPVEVDGRILIDGGFVNPTPFDLFPKEIQLTIGCDITGMPGGDQSKVPSLTEVVIGMAQLTQRSILAGKLEQTQPDIMLYPNVSNYRATEFFKVNEMLADAAPIKDELKRRLAEHIELAEAS